MKLVELHAFVQAEVRLPRALAPGRPPPAAAVTGDDLADLLGFFPGVGTGRKSALAGGWVSGLIVTLTRTDGSQTRVEVDTRYEFWTEGRGDWELKPGLRPLVEKILTPAINQT